MENKNQIVWTNLKNKFIFVPLALVISCSQVEELNIASPEEVALEYLKYKSIEDEFKINGLLSNEDKQYQVTKEEDFLDSLEIDKEALLNMRAAMSSQIDYKVLNSEVNESTAKVYVEISLPDYTKLLGDLFAMALKGTVDEQGDQEISLENQLTELALKNEIPRQIKKETVNLVYEEESWRVFVNNRLLSIISEAKELKKKKEYSKASLLLSTASEIDPSDENVKRLSSELETEMAAEAEKSDYYDKIRIFEVESKWGQPVLEDSKIPAIKFAIQNKGDKTLVKVKIKAIFFDIDGLPIFEKELTPINDGICWDNCGPLKPNYIWRGGPNEYYTMEGLGKEWSGEATVEIVDIKFE